MSLPLSSQKDFRPEVIEVLARRGVPASEREALKEALEHVTHPEATWNFLLRRSPNPRATLSPVDGIVQREGSDWLVVDDDGRELARFRAATQPFLRSAGTRVRAGELLYDGIVDPGDYLEIYGENQARPMLLALLREASGLGETQLELLLEPMLDAVMIDPRFPSARLPRGALMTRKRFDYECARDLRRELKHRRDSAREDEQSIDALLALDPTALLAAVLALPPESKWSTVLSGIPIGKAVLAGYGSLVAMDPQGLAVTTGRLLELGTFEVRKGKLSISGPEKLRRHPEHFAARNTQRYFGAQKGTWHAYAQLDQTASTLLGLRFWHHSHTPCFNEQEYRHEVLLESEVLVVTDLHKNVAHAALDGSLAKTITADLRDSRVVKIEPGGWACMPGPGSYPLLVEYGSDGLAVALAIDLRASCAANVPLRPGFELVCVLNGVRLGPMSAAQFEEKMGDVLGVRVQFLEALLTLPSRDADGNEVADTGGRSDIFFAVHKDDYSPAFNIERMTRGIRWLEDAVSHSNFPRAVPWLTEQEAGKSFEFCEEREAMNTGSI